MGQGLPHGVDAPRQWPLVPDARESKSVGFKSARAVHVLATRAQVDPTMFVKALNFETSHTIGQGMRLPTCV